MKFVDQTGVTKLITLTKIALKPLEAFKNSVTDVNGIVKSDGKGGFSAAAAGTDYAAASHTHSYLPLTGGTVTGAIIYPNAENIYDTDGNILGAEFLVLDSTNQIVRTKIKDTNLVEAIGAAPKKHTHVKADITDFPTSITPSAHKASHKTGGSDALSPADIGAAAASHNHSASNITSGTVSIARGGTGATNASSALTNLGAQAKVKTLTLSIATAGWSATTKRVLCSASGVTASNVVIISPAATSQDAYSAAGVKCTAQGNSSLTFSCESIPTEALSVNVVIL